MGEHITNREIRELYKDPSYGLSGLSSFLQKLKSEGYDITLQRLKEVLGDDEVVQVMKKAITHSYYKINAPPKHYQLDTMFLNYTKTTYPVLVLIDILSRKAFLFPLRDNTIEEKKKVLNNFMEEGNLILGLSGDAEFDKKTFINFLNEKNIEYKFDIAENEHITKGDRLGIVDRFIRTFRRRLIRYMVENKTLNFMPALQKILDGYNNTPHISLYGKTPNEIYDSLMYSNLIMELNEKHNRKVREKQNDIQEGDFVRVVLLKKKYEKEGITFSNDVYVVDKKDGNRFIVKTLKDEIVDKRYKYNELQKVSPEVFRRKMEKQEKTININFEDTEREKQEIENIRESPEMNIQREIDTNKEERKREQRHIRLELKQENLREGTRRRKAKVIESL